MKALITATVLSHIAQFHHPLGDLLHEAGYEVHVAALDNLAQKNGLKIDWADKVFNVPFDRSPKSIDNVKAYRQLKQIIDRENYDFIHCNTPMGGIVTRLAANGARKNGCKIIYTAHGFHFHKRASRLAWLVYYPIERIFARFTDILITINHEDYTLASNKFACETCYTHGVGVDSSRYLPLENKSERIALCNQLGIPSDAQIILSIGEFLPNKNQSMALSAMKTVVSGNPKALLVLAGNGPMKNSLEQQVKTLGIESNVRFIGYCTCLEKYQKIADILVACSFREGLPLNLVEAMLAENPVVASHNRGHDELITHGSTGFLVEPDDATSMAGYISDLLNDSELRERMGKEAREFALDYSSENVTKELQDIYGL